MRPGQVMIEALAANSPAAACSEAEILSLIDRVHAEKFKVVPDCAICASPCGRTADYNMANIWNAPEDIRSLKVLILLGVHGWRAMRTAPWRWACRTTR